MSISIQTPLGSALTPLPLDIRVRRAAIRLAAHGRSAAWAGHDPYDALNSLVFERSPFAGSRLVRLGLTQALKRLPLDTRWLLRVPAVQNPKGLALFLSASLKLAQLGVREAEADARRLADRVLTLRSPFSEAWCWGYPFPWQTRRRLVPRHFPNLVSTVFVADSLLDAYEAFGESRFLDAATGAGRWMVSELYWSEAGSSGFGYPLPDVRASVHNANLLAAALLLRLNRTVSEPRLAEAALAAATHSVDQQRADGSWLYGEGANQSWIDHFHTGFNLSALTSIRSSLGDGRFDEALRHGVRYYLTHLFDDDGLPKYFSHRAEPIDIHCVAQAVITLTHVNPLDEAARALRDKVLAWSLDHMQSRVGTFHYQRWPWFTNRLNYMRWSQAWMLVALATWLA